MGLIGTNSKAEGVDITNKDMNIYSITSENTPSNPYEISIEKNADDTYSLKTLQGYVGVGSGNTDLGSGTSNTDNKYRWEISFTTQNNVTIQNKSKTDRFIRMYDVSEDFRAYTSSTGLAVQLYRKVGEVTAAEAVENHATFYANYAYVMPDGVTGYAVTADATEGTLTKTEAYAAGDEVPAATPLLLEAKEAGTFYPVVLNKTIDAYEGENYLEGGRDENGMTKSASAGSVLYYKLAVVDSSAGFYWGAEGGAAFAMTKPTTAYLAVPVLGENAVRGFAFADSSVTGIGHAAAAVADEAVYTLSGVRVSAAKSELPAGIYVVNGKKLMVK